LFLSSPDTFQCMAFTNPWFLLGLLAIAIPIAIHLFELRRPQKIDFTNVEFIREVKLVTDKQRKVKHLLVLAARLCLVVFLVLLFTQPFIPAKERTTSDGIVSVWVDQSQSMQQKGADGQPAFEAALKEADELPLAFPALTKFSLNGVRGNSNGAAFRTDIQQLQLSGQAPSIAKRLKQAVAVRDKGPLFVFSDFQKNSFSAQSLAAVDTSRQLLLVPLSGETASNIFVDSVWLDDAFVRTDVDAVLRVRVRNGGKQAVQNCPVKLFIGDKQAGAFQVSVAARQTATSGVRVRLQDAAAQPCRIEVEDAPVDFDNTYYFMLQPSAKIRVVEVASAGMLGELYGNEPLFAYQHLNPQSVDYRALQEANLILLREAVLLSTGLQEGLRQAVQRGATIVIVPPETAAARVAYMNLFRALGVGGIQWEDMPVNKQPALRDVAEPSRQNPFFRDVFAGQSRPAGMPKATPVLRWARSGTDILRFRDGEGFLAAFPSAKGSVYVFSSPLNQAYSDFTQNALFVPVMYRLAMQSYQQEQPLAYQLSEATVSIGLGQQGSAVSNAREVVFKLRRDSATYIPAQRVQAGQLVLDVPPGMQQPGYYELLRGTQVMGKLAFNYDKRESDLDSYSAAELRRLVGEKHPNVQVYEPGAGQTVAAHYKATRVGVPLWRYCLIGALLCLLAEALLLRFSGRRPVPAPLAQAA
jgi:hypothetical protein